MYSRVAEEEGLPYRRNTEASRLRRTANRKTAEVCDLDDAWSKEMAEDRDGKSAAEVREKRGGLEETSTSQQALYRHGGGQQ
jgi:hypothetical protein